jgi:hypothetical protein
MSLQALVCLLCGCTKHSSGCCSSLLAQLLEHSCTSNIQAGIMYDATPQACHTNCGWQTHARRLPTMPSQQLTAMKQGHCRQHCCRCPQDCQWTADGAPSTGHPAADRSEVRFLLATVHSEHPAALLPLLNHHQRRSHRPGCWRHPSPVPPRIHRHIMDIYEL